MEIKNGKYQMNCRYLIKCKRMEELEKLKSRCEVGLPYAWVWANLEDIKNFPVYIEVSFIEMYGLMLHDILDQEKFAKEKEMNDRADIVFRTYDEFIRNEADTIKASMDIQSKIKVLTKDGIILMTPKELAVRIQEQTLTQVYAGELHFLEAEDKSDYNLKKIQEYSKEELCIINKSHRYMREFECDTFYYQISTKTNALKLKEYRKKVEIPERTKELVRKKEFLKNKIKSIDLEITRLKKELTD